jgi:hypothetical protein
MNGKWQYFLNSLATVGGNLVLLFLCFFVLLGLVLHVLHSSNVSDQVSTVIVTTFSAFSGALLQALRGRTSDTNPPPGGGTSTSSTRTETTMPMVPPKP